MSSPSDASTAPASANEPFDLTGKRVVICEDEGITLLQVKRVLTQAGMIVAGIADNGEAAVETALREQPDVILMDIRMPKMNGLEAARRIRSEIPACIVMLTAFSDEAYQQEARELGACGYVIKPIARDTLLPALRKALADFSTDAS